MKWRCTLWVPVFRYRVEVTFASPRRPTLLEEMLVRLCKRFSDHREFGGLRLEQVCEEILGLAYSREVMQPVLQRLMDQGILRCDSSLEPWSALQLRYLRLTSLGERLLHKGLLPARSHQQEDDLLFDPATREFLPPSPMIQQAARGMALPEPETPHPLPEEGACRWYSRNRPSWLSEAAEIQQVRTLAHRTQWYPCPVTVTLNGGELHCESNRAAYSSYLQSLPRDVLEASLLSPLWEQASPLTQAGAERAVEVDLRAGESLPTETDTVAASLRRLLAQANWAVVLEPLAAGLEADSPRRCLILAGEPSGPPEVKKSPQGFLIRWREPSSLSGFLAGSLQAVVQAVRLKVRLAGEELSPVLATLCRSEEHVQAIRQYLEELAQQLFLARPEDAPLALHWQEPAHFWSRIQEALRRHFDDPCRRVAVLRSVLQGYRRLGFPRAGQTTRRQMLALLEQGPSELSADQVLGIVASLQEAGIAPSALQKEFLPLLGRLARPRSVDQLTRLDRLFHSYGVSPAWEMPPELLREICQRIAQKGLPPVFQRHKGALPLFQKISQAAEALLRQPRFTPLQGPLGEQQLAELATHAVRDQKILRHLHALASAWEQAVLQLPELAETAQQTALAHLVDNARKILRYPLSPGKEPPLVVLDVSALVESPQLAGLPGWQVVIPRDALKKLKSMKQKTAQRSRAEAALRAVEAHRERIQWASASGKRDHSEVPILQVAQRFRSRGVLLVTQDAALRRQAESAGVEACSVEEFQARLSDSPTAGVFSTKTLHDRSSES